jgi:hypothetical protein
MTHQTCWGWHWVSWGGYAKRKRKRRRRRNEVLVTIRKVGIVRVDGSRAGQTDERKEGDEILENHVDLGSWLIVSLVLF